MPHPAWTGAIDRGAIGAYSPLWLSCRRLERVRRHAQIGSGPLRGNLRGKARARRAAPYWSATERAAAAAATPFRGSFDEAPSALAGIARRRGGAAHGSGRAARRVPVGRHRQLDRRGGDAEGAARHGAQLLHRLPRRRLRRIAARGSRRAPSRHRAHDAPGERARMSRDPAASRARLYDEPFADASQIPTLVLCRADARARDGGLSGDGGDELFGGYDRYARAASQWRRLERGRPGRGARPAPPRARSPERRWRPARRLRRLARQRSAWHARKLSIATISRAGGPNDGLAPQLGAAATPVRRAARPRPALARPAIHAARRDDLSAGRSSGQGRPRQHGVRARGARAACSTIASPSSPGRCRLRLRRRREAPAARRRSMPACRARWSTGRSTASSRRSRAGSREGLRDWADDLLSPARLQKHGFVAPRIVAHRAGARTARDSATGRARSGPSSCSRPGSTVRNPAALRHCHREGGAP